MHRALAAAVLVAGCGRVGFEPPIDAPAKPPCDPSAPFGAPSLVAGLNATSYAAVARLSTDELEVFFQAIPATTKQIYTARRPTTAESFGAWQLLGINDATVDNYDATLSRDGVTLLFASPRPGGSGGIDIYRATRATPSGDFGAPALVAAIDTPINEDQPYVMGSNAAVWYNSVASGSEDIWEALSGAGAPVSSLNSPKSETFPTPSADGTVVYFGSDRAGPGHDIYVATRASVADPFAPPVPVVELDTPAEDEPSWLSPDLCRLYLTSTRLGTSNVFVAER